MTASIFSRTLPTALALAFAAAAMTAQAQSTNPTGPGGSAATRNQAGESYPNDPKAASDKGSPKVVQDAEQSRPAQATKRVAKKGGNMASNAGHRAADATRGAGESIARHLPGKKGSTSKESAADQTAK